MRAYILAFGLACCAGSVQAGELLDKKDISEIVELMVDAHKIDKKNGMRKAESECWQGMAKEGRSAAHYSLAFCGIAGMAGHFIALSEAEKSGKKIAAYWTDDAVAERMGKFALKMKIPQELAESTMDEEIGGNAENLAKALMKKGYLLD